MLDSDEEDEGEGGVAAGEPTAVGVGGGVGGGELAGGTPTIGDDEELSNDNENFSHVSGYSDVIIMHVSSVLSPPPSPVMYGGNLSEHFTCNFGKNFKDHLN